MRAPCGGICHVNRHVNEKPLGLEVVSSLGPGNPSVKLGMQAQLFAAPLEVIITPIAER